LQTEQYNNEKRQTNNDHYIFSQNVQLYFTAKTFTTMNDFITTPQHQHGKINGQNTQHKIMPQTNNACYFLSAQQ